MSSFILYFLNILIQILILAVIGRALISWFPVSPTNPLVRVLNEVTDPILEPIRRVVPRLGMLDITPMVAIIVLMVIQQSLASI